MLHHIIVKWTGETDKAALALRTRQLYKVANEIDGEILDAKNYTATEGSTIITLKADYVATLSVGEHTIGIVSESGTAETTFTVNAKAVEDPLQTQEETTESKPGKNNSKKSPETGNDGATALWLALLLSCGGAIIVTGAYGKRKKHSR